jgi:hypothetical protein
MTIAKNRLWGCNVGFPLQPVPTMRLLPRALQACAATSRGLRIQAINAATYGLARVKNTITRDAREKLSDDAAADS